jgi:hypothetical protein
MRFLRGIGFFVATLLIGEVVRRLLMSRLGGAAAERFGRPELATFEGANAASSEVKKAVGIVRSLAGGRAAAETTGPVVPPQTGWVGIARDASEMLLAAGAVLKTISDFVHEDTKLRGRVARAKTKTT